MPLYYRTFASGAEEHRPDSEALGAAAYTEANVPARYAGQAWQVAERPYPIPAEEDASALLGGRLGGQRLHGGRTALERLRLRGTAEPGAQAGVEIDDVLVLSGDGAALLEIPKEEPGPPGAATGRFPVRIASTGLIRYVQTRGG